VLDLGWGAVTYISFVQCSFHLGGSRVCCMVGVEFFISIHKRASLEVMQYLKIGFVVSYLWPEFRM